MDEFIKLFGVMLAVMIPVAIGGGIFVLIAGNIKRSKRRLAASTPDLEQLERRLDDLEQGQRQVHELAERLDFVERMLPALREGK